MTDDVAAVFGSYPASLRPKLLELRSLIVDTAATTEGVGEVEEALRWGEPGYLTRPKTGTTVRISPVKGEPGRYGLFVNCQTTLIGAFRQIYPDLEYEGSRAITFHVEDDVPQDRLGHCIAMALRYHLDKKGRTPGS